MSVLATDDFNRADGGLGGNWTTMLFPGGAPEIISNKVGRNDAAQCGAYHTGITWPNDQYSQVSIAAAVSKVRVLVRAVNIAGEANFYMLQVSTIDTAIGLYKYINGVGFTALATGTATVVNGDVIYCEAQGTSIAGKINGATVLTATDSAITSGSPGFHVMDLGSDRIDNFEGGNFGSGVLPGPLSGDSRLINSSLLAGRLAL